MTQGLMAPPADVYVTSDKMWPMGAEVERGDLPKQDLEVAQRGACPACGACQFGTDGGVAVLYGNLAPGGAMIKTFSVPKEMHVHTGPARVFDIEEEPAKQRDWKPENPLFTLPNVILTPHAAYYSEESIHTVRDFAAHEVVRVLTGQPPVSAVNADQLAGPAGSHQPS